MLVTAESQYSLVDGIDPEMAGELRRGANIVGLLILGTVIIVGLGTLAANRNSDP